ncbi:bifunctional diguanylate cyclase/phosphodiesterase [Klenkia sp. LSe6-5]|uniref:Bifunctional diguanylate cyclase/phosphodiesterase n=1 Tax=Klenkia sesuvii TaxID=3103137 RepID=A0ABU8DXH6_9ACTN
MSRWQAPEVATPRVIARTLTTFYVLGAVASYGAAAGASSAGPGRGVLVVFGTAALLAAGVLARWLPRWPRGVFHVPVSGAAVLLAAVAAVAPDPTTAVVVAAMTAFVAVDAHFFFARPVAVAHVVVAVTAVSVGLVVQGAVHPGTVLALDVVVLALALVTAQLVSRASSASRDALTGLRNRRGFDDALDELIDTCRRTGTPLSAALLDLDHFKQVNDTSGHAAGDALLCAVAEHWQRALPRSAVLARHGGDEFALLLPGVTGTDALDLVRGAAVGAAGQLSVGVAELAAADGPADLVRRADRALYDAKRAGRGRVELDGGPGAELAADLAAALDAGDVQVVYQGVVDVSSGACVGVEALARWTHPVHGPIGPDVFVPVAEQHGLVGALGQHVLRTAVADLARIRDTTGTQLVLGVNVSGCELTDPAYPQRVLAVLAERDWPAEWLVLEITESVLDAESSAATDGLAALRRAGLHAAVDDFGTGYSSLSRLDTLPVDHLKVDATFTATLTTSPRRVQVLRSLLSLADALAVEVVVEGVETAEQHTVLQQMGCRFAQGWFYDRPAPADHLATRFLSPVTAVRAEWGTRPAPRDPVQL